MDRKLALQVELDARGFRAGDVVAGRAVATTAVQVNGVVLVAALVCREVIEWNDSDSGRHWHAYDHFCEEMALTSLNASLAVGTHVYPIKWALPLELPDHLDMRPAHTTNFVETCVILTARMGGRLVRDHVVQLPMTVSSPALTHSVVGKMVHEEVHQDVRLFGVLLKGKCTVALDLRSDVIEWGSANLDVKTAIDNASSRRLKGLTVSLIQCVAKKTPSQISTTNVHVAAWNCTEMLSAAVAAGSGTQNSVTVTMPLSLPQSELTSPTRRTHFMDISYAVEVACALHRAPSVRLRVPVIVLRRDP